MTRYVALLRGINVGGHNRVSMADLKTVFETLGCQNVTSLIQSGNIVYAADTPLSSEMLRKEILRLLGFSVPVVVRTATELSAIVKRLPFSDLDASKIHVGFFASAPDATDVAAIEPTEFAPEKFSVVSKEVYLYLPNGVARTKLPGLLERRLEIPVTVRNWRTVCALESLANL